MASLLAGLREGGGRLFVLGVGGSAATASHAVNDFRKLCGIEAYAPTDNVAELTARANDDGWHSVFSEWLRTSRLGREDAVLVLSVGGGDRERDVSANLVRALEVAREARGAGAGHRRPRRRAYRRGGRCLRRRADGEPGARHRPHGGVPGRDLPPARVASRAPDPRSEVGVDALSDPRRILHVDMDAFYAAVEQRDRPELRGKPVIVGADPQGGRGRGVVATASYEARRFGVGSAMPISQAWKACPHGVYVRPDMAKYAAVSSPGVRRSCAGSPTRWSRSRSTRRSST